MPSSYTASLRFELQFTGENVNLWGDKLNAALSRVDSSIAGWLTKALTADYSLTTANGGADEARSAMLKFTGTGAFTVTIPAVSKRYDVWNACTDVLTISNGSASVTLQPGEIVAVATDGGANIKRVQATDFGGATLTNVGQVSGLSAPTTGSQAATKQYVDDASFAAAAGNLPSQSGNAGKFLTTDGASASWGVTVSGSRKVLAGGLATGGGDLSADRTITVTAAAAADFCAGSDTTKAATAAPMLSALAEVALFQNAGTIVSGSSANTVLDHATFISGALTLSANATLPNLTNPKLRTGRIRGTQNASAAKTLSFGANWKPMGGDQPPITVTLGADFFIDFEVISGSYTRYSVNNMG